MHLQSGSVSCLVTANLCELLHRNLCVLEPSGYEIGHLELCKSFAVELGFQLLQQVRKY